MASIETERTAGPTVTLNARAGFKTLAELDKANQRALVEAVARLERQKPGR